MLRDLREGLRILSSREFWRDFRAYYSRDAVAARLQALAKRLDEYTGRDRQD